MVNLNEIKDDLITEVKKVPSRFKFFGDWSVGVDVADNTIEVAKLAKKGGKVVVEGLGRVTFSSGIVERGRIKDEKRLKEFIKKAFSKAKPKPIKTNKIILGLPDSQTYFHIFTLQEFKPSDRERLIREEVIKSIPLKEKDINFSYKILSKEKNNSYQVLVVASSHQTIDEWKKFFSDLGMTVEFFDIEQLASFGGLVGSYPKKPICLVDIGAATTNISVFNKHGLQYAHALNKGGKAISDEIKKSLKISFDQAEEKKKKIGLSDSESRIFTIVIKVIEPILKSIESSCLLFEEKSGEKVEEVIIIGGTSRLKNLKKYFTSNLDRKTSLGNELTDGHKLAGFKIKRSLEFVEAVGLALRGIQKKKYYEDPIIFPQEAESISGSPEKKKPVAMPTEDEPSLQTDKKIIKQKRILVFILIFGVVIIGGAFTLRSMRGSDDSNGLANQQDKYSMFQSISVDVPVAVDVNDYSDDNVRARIVTDSLKLDSSLSNAQAQSRSAVEEKLKSGEALWSSPLNIDNLGESDNDQETEVTFEWLIYSDDDVKRLAVRQVNEKNIEDVDYILSAINKDNLNVTEGTYSLEVTVNIFTDRLIVN